MLAAVPDALVLFRRCIPKRPPVAMQHLLKLGDAFLKPGVGIVQGRFRVDPTGTRQAH